jgi:hypothetical protein
LIALAYIGTLLWTNSVIELFLKPPELNRLLPNANTSLYSLFTFLLFVFLDIASGSISSGGFLAIKRYRLPLASATIFPKFKTLNQTLAVL